MLSEAENVPAKDAPSWPVLTMVQRRVLGVLVEKAKTTPDAYPLSLNALVTGSNQKSNRDPMPNLSDVEVEEALASLQNQLLVSRISGGRVERWRHLLYEAWKADKVELAILGELLLRGPQTEGELRGRAARMEPIDDLDMLRVIMKRLAERNLVIYLTPEGRRGTVVTHGFHAPDELPRLRRVHGAAAGVDSFSSPEPVISSSPVARAGSPPEDSVEALKKEVAFLRENMDGVRARITEIEGQMQRMAEEFQQLKRSLGG